MYDIYVYRPELFPMAHWLELLDIAYGLLEGTVCYFR